MDIRCTLELCNPATGNKAICTEKKEERVKGTEAFFQLWTWLKIFRSQWCQDEILSHNNHNRRWENYLFEMRLSTLQCTVGDAAAAGIVQTNIDSENWNSVNNHCTLSSINSVLLSSAAFCTVQIRQSHTIYLLWNLQYMSVCLISQSQAAPLVKMRPEIILKKQNHKLIVIKTDNDVFTTLYDGDV